MVEREIIAKKAVEKIRTTLSPIYESNENNKSESTYSLRNIAKESFKNALIGGSLGLALGGIGGPLAYGGHAPSGLTLETTGKGLAVGALAGAVLGPAIKRFTNKIVK